VILKLLIITEQCYIKMSLKTPNSLNVDQNCEDRNLGGGKEQRVYYEHILKDNYFD
jgi:hypothetical protein